MDTRSLAAVYKMFYQARLGWMMEDWKLLAQLKLCKSTRWVIFCQIIKYLYCKVVKYWILFG